MKSVRWPAEWEPQSAVMLTWPRPGGDFAPHYPAVRDCFRQIVTAAARFQPVILSFADAALGAGETWSSPHPVRCHIAPSDDVWARDHGPIGVAGPSGSRLLKFRFDGWGGKYPAAQDNALAPALAAQGAFGDQVLETIDLTLEGGAIEGDGAGTLLATRRSVLDPRRNPGLDAAAIEQRLRDSLGVQRILWLDHGGLAGDDTDGHIDTLARFASPTQILYQAAGPDENRAGLEAMRAELEALRDGQGRPYQLSPLPWPGEHRAEDGGLLPASYANFLIINGAVLLPHYGVDQDAQASAVLAAAFPDREIVGIDCRALIRQYGSLHCVTMNLPA